MRDGRKVQHNLDRELISDEELMSQLRLQGVKALEEVELASMEGNGEVSVIRKERAGADGAGREAGVR